MLPPDPQNSDDANVAALNTPINTTPAQLRDAYAEKLASGDVTEEQLATLTSLLTLGKSKRLSLSALARLTEIDDGTMSKLFSANYNAKLVSICRRISDWRELYEQRLAINKSDFTETSLVKTIWKVCDNALLFQTIFPIYGDSQTGKTTALEKYAERDRTGRSIYIRMPSGGHLSNFLERLNAALFESTKTSGLWLRRRPMDVITSNNLLIIDEIHQATLVHGQGSARIGTIEYIRELWDHTHCGMVICGTNAFRNEIDSGRHKAMLEQLRRRGLPPLQLPDILPREDMDAIAAAYQLPPADDIVHRERVEWITRSGLRTYANYLKSGAKLAEKERSRITWKHVIGGHDIFAKLSAKPKPEGRS